MDDFPLYKGNPGNIMKVKVEAKSQSVIFCGISFLIFFAFRNKSTILCHYFNQSRLKASVHGLEVKEELSNDEYNFNEGSEMGEDGADVMCLQS